MKSTAIFLHCHFPLWKWIPALHWTPLLNESQSFLSVSLITSGPKLLSVLFECGIDDFQLVSSERGSWSLSNGPCIACPINNCDTNFGNWSRSFVISIFSLLVSRRKISSVPQIPRRKTRRTSCHDSPWFFIKRGSHTSRQCSRVPPSNYCWCCVCFECCSSLGSMKSQKHSRFVRLR